jgi:hypothetical protein
VPGGGHHHGIERLLGPRPVLKRGDDDLSQAYKDQLAKDAALQVGVDAFKVGRTYPFYRRYTQITGEPYAPIMAAIRGEMDITAALAEAERLTNQALLR